MASLGSTSDNPWSPDDKQADWFRKLLALSAASLNYAQRAMTTSMPVKYNLKKISASFFRPNDTTPYTVGDAVSNSAAAATPFALDLGPIGAVAGQGIEVRKLAVISSAKQSTLPLFNVYLSPTTFAATTDNSALDITDAIMEAGGSWFACDVQNYTVSNSRVAYIGVPAPMVLDAADAKLYGTLQAANAYTPVSGEKLTIIAWVALL